MSTAPQIQTKRVSETRNVAVSFSGLLDSSEVLTGTPTVTEVTTNDLTLSNKVLNASAVIINGESVPANEAILFSVLGGIPKYYTIQLSCSTDATPAQVLYDNIILDVIAD